MVSLPEVCRSQEFWSGYWSPDGQRFLLAGLDTVIYSASGQVERILPDVIVGSHCPWSPDGGRLATSDYIWDIRTGNPTCCDSPAPWVEVAWDPQGRRVAGICRGLQMTGIWDATTGVLLTELSGCEYEPGSLAWSADGGLVVTGTHQSVAMVWDAATGQLVATLSDPNQAGKVGSTWNVAFVSDTVVSTSDGRAYREWEVATGRPISTRPAVPWQEPGLVHAGRRIEPKAATLVDADAHTTKLPIPVGGHWISVSADGTRAATYDRDGCALWRLDAPAPDVTIAAGGTIRTLDWSRDGAQVAIGTADGRVRIFDAASGEPVADLGYGSWVEDVVFGDSQVLVVRGGSELQVFDEQAQVVASLAHPGGVSTPSWSSDARAIAFGDYDSGDGVYVWEPETGDLHPLREPSKSPCGWGTDYLTSSWGSRLVLGSFTGVEVLHLDRNYRVDTLVVAEPTRGFDAAMGVGHVTFSPDGSCFATDEAGLTIRDAVTGAVVAAHREPVACDQIRWVSPATILTACSYGVYTWQFSLKPAKLRLIRLWTPGKGP